MAHLTEEYIQQLYEEFGELRVLDDIVQHRAKDSPPAPILGYPTTDSLSHYEQITGEQLDHFVDCAVKYFLEAGLKPVWLSRIPTLDLPKWWETTMTLTSRDIILAQNMRDVVGILAQSNVDFVVTFFALSRLGYTVLCLSLRLPPVALVNLLKQTDCSTVVHGDHAQIAANVEAVRQEQPLKPVPIPTRAAYTAARFAEQPRFERIFRRESETDETGLIMHSSGSTGLPKPVFLSHKNVLTHPVQGVGMHNFGALPLYHMYGLSTTLQAMYMRKTANLISASLPLTAGNIVAAVETTKPEVFHAVPYALGLMVEHERGIECLRAMKIVTAAGARTPDELGDRLVQEGVNFGVVFGTTEAGLLGDSMGREKGDDSWSYVRIYSNIRKSIHMDPIGGPQCEAVYLPSHPGCSTSNSDDPEPGSWRSKDVFEPHESIPDVWKYVTRLDDRVTLSNGEKVLPLPIEGRLRQDDLIREAVVVGVDKPVPGVLAFKSDDAKDMSTTTFIETVGPTIDDANAHAEEFSQIGKDMVAVLPSDAEYPKTDKGSIIRAQVYKKYKQDIDNMYNEDAEEVQGTLQLDLPQIETFLAKTYKDVVGTELESIETDFFNAGVDSLKALQIRRVIQKTLDLKGKRLGNNVVYDLGNIPKLAKYLSHLVDGEEVDTPEDVTAALMQEMIDKYSSFAEDTAEKSNGSDVVPNLVNGVDNGQTAILTGATGSMGAHMLAQLVQHSDISRVVCLVRGANPIERVLASLQARGLELDRESAQKITALTADLSQSDLGLGPTAMSQLQREATLVIHFAWPVNFNIALPSFEPHIAGLHNLLRLAMTARHHHHDGGARLFFASSVSVAEATTNPAAKSIPEEPIADFAQAAPMGYARSKLVGEHVVLAAAKAGARAYVLRVGQVVGDRAHGQWNESEFVPSLIRSALALGVLPDLPGETCSWLPVDALARVVVELDQTLRQDDTENPSVVYNLVNPRLFSWAELLESLGRAGLKFRVVSFEEWLRKLRESAERGEQDRNPAVKLIDHFEKRYGGLPPDGETDVGVSFETKTVTRDSAVLRDPPDIIRDGYVNKFVATWLEQWLPDHENGE